MKTNKFDMKRIFTLIAILFFSISFFSCSSNIYYIGETSEAINVYSKIDTTSTVNYIIPIGSRVLTVKKPHKYHYIIYENYSGYVYRPKYKNYHKYNSSTDGMLYGYSSSKPKNKSSYKSSSSYSSSSNSKSSSGGTVNVKGYYRKDGTYVRPHTRKSPKH